MPVNQVVIHSTAPAGSFLGNRVGAGVAVGDGFQDGEVVAQLAEFGAQEEEGFIVQDAIGGTVQTVERF